MAKRNVKRSTHLDRDVKIHICKDGTISYRNLNERVFNGIALPVFSVDTVQQAQDIQVRFGRRQYIKHPDMVDGRDWYKLSVLEDGTDLQLRGDGTLEFDDLPGVTRLFQKWWDEQS